MRIHPTRTPTRRNLLQGLGSIISLATLGGELRAQPKSSPLLRTYAAHDDIVNSVAFSPDGRTALSGSYDETLRLWDATTGNTIRTFKGHSGSVNAVAFMPDGRTVLSASSDTTLKLWDVATGKELRTLTGHSEGVFRIALSSDGRTLLSGADRQTTVKLWDLATGAEIRTFQNVGPTCALSPDGRMILAIADKYTIKLLETATGKELQVLSGHTGPAYALAFLPDGRTALSGGYNRYTSNGHAGVGALRLWDLSSGKQLHSITISDDSAPVWAFAVLAGGRFILTGNDDGTLQIREIPSGKLLHTFTGQPERILSVAVSPDGSKALSGGLDRTAMVWGLPKL